MSAIIKKSSHPFLNFFCFASTLFFILSVKSPVNLSIFFLWSLAGNLIYKNFSPLKNLIKLIPFFVFLSLLNPFVSHWGNTHLFYIFGNPQKPFTLESLLYGLNTALMLLTILLNFMFFAKILTSEKMNYLFSPYFPNFCLLMNMIIRFMTLIFQKKEEIETDRKGLFLEKEKEADLREKFVYKKEILFLTLSQTLKDGKITAETMENRNFGKSKKRGNFIEYKASAKDYFLFFVILIFFALMIFEFSFGAGKIAFYPVFEFSGGIFNFRNIVFFCAQNIFMAVIVFFVR